MTIDEAIALCRYVRAACPQQAIDAYTPDTWFDLLGDLRYAEALDAVKDIASRQPFVAPSEIRAEVKRTRNDRIIRADHPIPPANLDPAEAKAWLCDARRRIADGEHLDNTAVRGQLTADPAGQPEAAALVAGLVAAASREIRRPVHTS